LNLFQAILLGIVQGATEFIPISSSAHLIIIPWLFQWDDPGLAFDVALHLGTLVALLTFFARDWLHLLRAGILSILSLRAMFAKQSPHHELEIASDGNRPRNDGSDDVERRLAWYLLIGTLPGAIARRAVREQNRRTVPRTERAARLERDDRDGHHHRAAGRGVVRRGTDRAAHARAA
jgi:undecaprenyl pyrophosphate phosphatase UppP